MAIPDCFITRQKDPFSKGLVGHFIEFYPPWYTCMYQDGNSCFINCGY